MAYEHLPPFHLFPYLGSSRMYCAPTEERGIAEVLFGAPVDYRDWIKQNRDAVLDRYEWGFLE